MGFQDRGFDTTIYKEESKEENKFVIIACEGAETEYQYFHLIKSKLELKATVKMEIIKRSEDEKNSSAPTKVVETLQNISKEKLQDIKIKNLSEDSFDIYWIVVDREKQESKKINLEKAIATCKEESYNIALSNPSFEFWLLLHVVDINTYDREQLFENKKESKKRYLEKELSKVLKGYNKVKIKEVDFISNEKIKKALNQEKVFENDLEKIIDNLGSNVGSLINEILIVE